MLRRLHHEQPDSFAFTAANQTWAEAQLTKFPTGREASAIIPLLWRAQEQEGWLTQQAIEHVADMLGLAYIRALEVATFYFMFQLQPVGSIANIQVCGTLSCMICGAEDLVSVCKEHIAEKPHTLSGDGKFSWEEVECLGACSNAPMVQIGKDFYEDLTAARLKEILDELADGKVPVPGPQNGRFAAEPLSGLTSLEVDESGRIQHNASVALAVNIGDTVKRIDGTEVPMLAPWQKGAGPDRPVDQGGSAAAPSAKPAPAPKAKPPVKAEGKEPPARKAAKARASKPVAVAAKTSNAKANVKPTAPAAPTNSTIVESAPETLTKPRAGGADDLKRISGVGPKLETVLNEMGFWHFDQVAKWGAAEVAWVDARLKFKGRIERDDWISQAAKLCGE